MLTIRRAAAADQPQLMAIYRTAQEYMLQTGNPMTSETYVDEYDNPAL